MISLRSVLDEGALKCQFAVPNKHTHPCPVRKCPRRFASPSLQSHNAQDSDGVGVTGAMTQEARRENTGGVNVLLERRVQTGE